MPSTVRRFVEAFGKRAFGKRVFESDSAASVPIRASRAPSESSSDISTRMHHEPWIARNVLPDRWSLQPFPRERLQSIALSPAETARLHAVFDRALLLVRNALVRFQGVVRKASEAAVSRNVVDRMHRYVAIIERLVANIERQREAWLRGLGLSFATRGRVVFLPNWPLTPLTTHAPLPGMHYASAFDHVAPNVDAFMNESAFQSQRALAEIASHRVTPQTYGFHRARSPAELEALARDVRRTVHPNLHRLVEVSRRKALAHLEKKRT